MPTPQDNLFAAAKTGDIDKIKTLLAQGVDINTRNKYEATILMEAAFYGHRELVVFLLGHSQIKTNLIGRNGNTVLHRAIGPQKLEICKLLTPHCSLTLSNDRGQLPYDFAKKQWEVSKKGTTQNAGKIKSLEEIVNFLKPLTLFEACEAVDLPLVKRMVEEEGADVNTLVEMRWLTMRPEKKTFIATPLMRACCGQQTFKIAHYFLDNISNLDLDKRDHGDQTVFHYICSLSYSLKGKQEERGFAILEQDGSMHIIEKLLKRGANPNIQDNVTGTPLLYAVLRDAFRMVHLLVEKGQADLSLKYYNSSTGKADVTILDYARQHDPKIYQFLDARIHGNQNHASLVSQFSGCFIQQQPATPSPASPSQMGAARVLTASN